MDGGVGPTPAAPTLASRVTEGVSSIRVGVAAGQVPPSVKELELAAVRCVPEDGQGARGAGGEGGHGLVHPNIIFPSFHSGLPDFTIRNHHIKVLVVINLVMVVRVVDPSWSNHLAGEDHQVRASIFGGDDRQGHDTLPDQLFYLKLPLLPLKHGVSCRCKMFMNDLPASRSLNLGVTEILTTI